MVKVFRVAQIKQRQHGSRSELAIRLAANSSRAFRPVRAPCEAGASEPVIAEQSAGALESSNLSGLR